MPLLMYGTRRSLLREACLDQVVDLTVRDPGKRALLVVPEQTKMDMERAYLDRSPTPGLMMAEVLSFRRLAWRLLAEVGRQPLHPIDSVGRAMLIQRVLRLKQSQLHAFASLADKPGFVSQVATVLGDLKRYRIGQDQLSAAAEQLEDKPLREKSQDLACVLAGYDEALAQVGLTDAEDDLTRLADVLQTLAALPPHNWPWPWSRLAWLQKTRIWINGFGELRDFTPQEDAVIQGLAAVAEQLTLTVVADAVPADRTVLDHGADAFSAGRRTAWRLHSLLPGLQRRLLDPPLAGLPAQIRSLLRTGQLTSRPEPADKPSSGPTAPAEAAAPFDGCQLKLVRACSTDDELTWIAGEIRRLVQLNGWRYRDISVAACDLPSVTPRLRAVFREYGIPLFLDMERPLSGTPFMRYVLGLLDTGLSNWSRPSLMGCLRSGLSGLEPDELDRLENEWLAHGLFRKDRLFNDRLYREQYLSSAEPAQDNDGIDQDEDGRAPLTVAEGGHTAAGPAASEDPVKPHAGSPVGETSTEELLLLRDMALLPVRQVLQSLQDARDIRSKVAALQAFLQAAGIAERIDSRVGVLAASGEMDVAIVLAQSWNALDRIFSQLQQLSPDLAVSQQQFRDLLAAGIDAAASGVIPSAIDQVSVGDLQHSMLRQPKILFLCGATASNLPPAPPPEGLLKDPDRQVLSRLIGLQLPSSARDKVFADACMIETLLTQPAEALYLSAPDVAVANLFRQLAEHYPDCLLNLPEYPDHKDARINAPGPAFRWILAGSPAGQADPDGDRIRTRLGFLLAEAGFRQPARQEQPSVIRADILRAIYPAPVVLSVSQLEKYAACPFSHLAERLLSLKQRQEWKPELTEMGTLLHGVLELALQAVQQKLHQLPEAEREECLAAFWRRWLETDLTEPVADWLRVAAGQRRLIRVFDAGLNASVGRRIRRTALSSLTVILHHFQTDPFVPGEFEWVFGPEAGHSLQLEDLAERPVWLRGMIDRVDFRTNPAAGGFRIIDYKSGQRTVDYDALYHGLALQLPVYLAAYARAHPDAEPEDAAWFTVNRPILPVKEKKNLQPERLQEQLMRLQKPVSLKLDPPDIRLLCRHSLRRASDIAGELLSGRFPVLPSRLPGRQTPCAWCDFTAFCQFDPQQGPWHRPQSPVAEQAAGSRRMTRQTFLALLHAAEQEAD